jgi:hypothetical protein
MRLFARIETFLAQAETMDGYRAIFCTVACRHCILYSASTLTARRGKYCAKLEMNFFDQVFEEKSMKIFYYVPLILAAFAAPAFANVTVSSPYNGEQVGSPFALSANAANCSSQTTAAMGYSFDSSTATTIVKSTSIQAMIASGTGAHILHVKAWGSAGSVCVTDIAITVAAATTAIPTSANITVSSPNNGAEVETPFALSANAAKCSSQTTTAMGYSLDNSTATTVVKSASIQAMVTAGTGAHTLHVKAWGSAGSACVADVAITVAATTAVIPTNAISVGGLQTLSNWVTQPDAGSAGSSTGSTSLINSPSLSGNARQFVSKYLDYGSQRFYASFGDDTAATHFLYDAWVYLPAPSTSIANVEMDMNQVMSNGQTVIFGIQCDGWSGTWDYTANQGTPQKYVDVWLHSKAACNPQQWSTNTWHHVQVSYSRDNSGNVTYSAVWLDGAASILNATVPSAFALGWAPALLTNFQVDGSLATSGTAAAYVDDLTIYRW